MIYKIPTHINSNKIFLINHSDIEGRVDPIFYGSDISRFIKGTPSEKLGAVCLNFKSGFGAGKEEQTNEENGIIQIRPTNIDNYGFLKFDKNVYVPENEKLNFLEQGTVLFNNTNSQELVGKTALIRTEERLYCSNHITAITVDKNKILPEYLWIILNLYQQHKIFFSICTNWNNQSGVGIDLLKSIRIPIFSIDKQNQIISRYLSAFEIKQSKDKEAQNLLDSIDDYLLEELGIKLPDSTQSNKSYLPKWMNSENPLVKNGRLFVTSSREVIGQRLDPDYTLKIGFLNALQSKYPFVQMKDIIDRPPQYGANEESIEGNSDTDIRYIRITDIDEHGNLRPDTFRTATTIENQYLLSVNDLLFARSGATAGKCYIHKSTDKDSIFAGYLIRFSLKSNIALPDYVFYFCNSKLYAYWVNMIQRPSAQPNINSEEFKSLLIPLPPLEKQSQIANYINSTRQRAFELQKEALKLLELAKRQIEIMILSE
jgi:restriction endonuclease S subunit